ncbi:hypothetical protein [Rhizobacter fulvus]
MKRTSSPQRIHAGNSNALAGGAKDLCPQPTVDFESPSSVNAYTVGKLLIGRGNAVMNNQILRSGAFASPSLGAALPVLADSSSFTISLHGVSPAADHLDLLLFAVSLIRTAPHPKLGVAVSFTTGQFLSTLGWAKNSDGYERVVQTARDLKRIELTFTDRSDTQYQKVHLVNFFATVIFPDRLSRERRWTVVLPAALFKVYDMRRNAVIDLKARAAIRSDFGRWLHAFFSSQTPSLERRFDAVALCAAGGMNCARAADTIKHLRVVLEMLSRGEVEVRSKTRNFAPVVESGWRIELDKRRGYVLFASRSKS